MGKPEEKMLFGTPKHRIFLGFDHLKWF